MKKQTITDNTSNEVLTPVSSSPNIYWIDLFCGAGGTSTGIHLAGQTVVACVNHDKNAIEAHAANHPTTIHFTEDIRDFHVVEKLQKIVNEIRFNDPNAIIAVWASLECTNFSKAKGGLPRDADSRTLAEHMFMYLRELRPEYFWVENVREFMAWGPLDENGKPISRTNGKDYLKWVSDVREFGYRFDYKIMNSANYGAFQSRERLFLQFASKDLPISWPEQTHTKDKRPDDLFGMKKWKAVREVLDLNDEGQSIFERKKPLSENTLKRILAGLVKFVAKGEPSFIKKYYSGRPAGKVISIDGPAGTVKTADGQAIVNTINFIQQRNQGEPSSRVIGVDNPARTITASGGNQEIVGVNYLTTYYGNGGAHSIDEPAPTIPTKDRCAIKSVLFAGQHIMNQYSNGGQHTDINSVCSTVTGIPKQNLITPEQWVMNTNFNNVGKSIDESMFTLTASRRHPYLINANSSTCPPKDLDNSAPSITSRTHLLINPSWFGHASSTDEPSVTIIARQDKAPLYLMAVENGPVAWLVFEDDCETMIAIKRFMVEWGITDIKMRMLKIPELLQIQGFPKNYILKGNQTEQKKQIGNAVEVFQSTAIANAFNAGIQKHFKPLAA